MDSIRVCPGVERRAFRLMESDPSFRGKVVSFLVDGAPCIPASRILMDAIIGFILHAGSPHERCFSTVSYMLNFGKEGERLEDGRVFGVLESMFERLRNGVSWNREIHAWERDERFTPYGDVGFVYEFSRFGALPEEDRLSAIRHLRGRVDAISENPGFGLIAAVFLEELSGPEVASSPCHIECLAHGGNMRQMYTAFGCAARKAFWRPVGEPVSEERREIMLGLKEFAKDSSVRGELVDGSDPLFERAAALEREDFRKFFGDLPDCYGGLECPVAKREARFMLHAVGVL